jgi:hypothetical protein
MSGVAMEESVDDSTSRASDEQRASNTRNDQILTKNDEVLDDDDDDEDEAEGDDPVSGNGEKKKKKKKKGKKKKSKTVGSKLPLSRCLLGFTDSYTKYGQTDPPTRLVSDLFPTGELFCCEFHLTRNI